MNAPHPQLLFLEGGRGDQPLRQTTSMDIIKSHITIGRLATFSKIHHQPKTALEEECVMQL